MTTQKSDRISTKVRAVTYICGVVLTLCAATPASADPITITGGAISLGSEGGFAYSIQGDGFASRTAFSFYPLAATGMDIGCLGTAAGCAAGAQVNLSTSTDGLAPLGQGNAIVNGTSYVDVALAGAWVITASEVTLPSASGGFTTLTSPFTFTGLLTGSQGGALLFSVTLRGGGDLFADVIGANGRWMLDEQSSVNYRFNATAPGPVDPAPVPEPASMVLLGTGLAGLAAARRRRHPAHPQH